ncbi:UFM1 specific peptidase 1 [Megachile rotundata]|uniref:UFM1 specific peptidase 1 n=1 Tax=Megachile rotundata TaxID=143995 RepID=UPI000258D7E9|nr:PREDICTED: ufm1-specific protease 1 [Megachile rotundata]XP_012151837.1 PREDICTED: ufm1-specific protease 1 [Megachile rotundata]XP_012151844.1 PREDICTED: ufm1-specific protease 1 [Megachile rotundata]
MSHDYSSDLLKNVHQGVLPPEPGTSFLIRGNYEYWHYGCDGFNDKGWGCGYRTLQTICSWVIMNGKLDQSVPSIRRIQEILVALEDKGESFIGSREWIGSFEVCLVLNHLYEVLSKIIHVPSGAALSEQIPAIKQHFEEFGSPIMMGGDRDCSSKCIVGIHQGAKNIYMLIVDPHFIGRAKNSEQLEAYHWVKWQDIKNFVDSSFYNLCLPQVKCMNGQELKAAN